MTNVNRLDRLIVRLCYVRNILTKHGHEIDFDLDLHSAESEVNSLFEAAVTQAEEISNDNARD